jgi:hypothetical protein
MVNYANGKIYKIEPIVEHDEGDIYIGSTTKLYLSQRFEKHRSDYKGWKLGNGSKITSFNIFDKYGVENCEMYLIENVNAKSKDELRAKEGYHIRNLKCVNRCVAGRTPKEYSKIYNEENKDKIFNRKKKYREDHKEEIKLIKSIKFQCECGSTLRTSDKARHTRSIKHVEFIKNKNLL